jgi:hypothetical protein
MSEADGHDVSHPDRPFVYARHCEAPLAHRLKRGFIESRDAAYDLGRDDLPLLIDEQGNDDHAAQAPRLGFGRERRRDRVFELRRRDVLARDHRRLVRRRSRVHAERQRRQKAAD